MRKAQPTQMSKLITQFTQAEYINFYEALKTYALKYASRFFPDVSLRDEVVDSALDRVENYLIKEGKVDIPFAKVIIKNSIKNSSSRRKISSSDLKNTEYNQWGFRGRKIK
jgi:hypothetical protein